MPVRPLCYNRWQPGEAIRGIPVQCAASELDALLGVVQEMARIVDVESPYMDTVLWLTKQMGRVAGVYAVFPEPEEDGEELAVDYPAMQGARRKVQPMT